MKVYNSSVSVHTRQLEIGPDIVWNGEAGSQRNSMLGDWYICTINEPGQVKMIKLILQLNIDKTTANQNISSLFGAPWLF